MLHHVASTPRSLESEVASNFEAGSEAPEFDRPGTVLDGLMHDTFELSHFRSLATESRDVKQSQEKNTKILSTGIHRSKKFQDPLKLCGELFEARGPL